MTYKEAREYLFPVAANCVLPQYAAALEKAMEALGIAESVVRCKECKHFADAKGKDSGKPCGYGQCKFATGIRGIVCADDFCSFGERRADNG